MKIQWSNMNTIRKLSLNDKTDYGFCFACGPNNPHGLKLKFRSYQNKISCKFTPTNVHQGFPKYLHGGIITALLDEVMSRVSLLENRWTMTVRLEVRFRHPIIIEQEITATSEKINDKGKFIQAKGVLKIEDGTIAADAIGTFAYVPEKTLTKITKDYPLLAKEWMI